MKSIFRNSILPLTVILFSILTSMSLAESPDPKFDADFVEAKKIEATMPAKAYEAYAKVKNESKDRELQADAQLRAALFAMGAGYGATNDARADGDQKALTNLKDLKLNFKDTAAGQTAIRGEMLENIQQVIDKYNSKQTSYKVVDSLVGLTGHIPGFSYWFALALIAVIVKTMTLPLTLKMFKSQKEMQKVQPLMKQIQEKYSKDKLKQQEELTKLYKEHKINPLASCFPMLIQLPFMIWVYNTIRLYEFHFSNGKMLWIGSSLSHKYPEMIGGNLSQFDFPLLVLYAATNYLTMRMTPATDPQAAQSQKMSSVMVTLMMFYFCMTSRWSSAFIFYWLVLNILGALQSYYFIYKPNKIDATNKAQHGSGKLIPATVVAVAPSPPPMRQQPKRKK